MKRFILIYLGVYCSLLFSQGELPLYRETKRCKISCLMQDNRIADELAKETEFFFDELIKKFNYQSNLKINLNIYPDIQSFHVAIGNSTAPQWLVASYGGSTIKVVSPNNAGLVHSSDSIKKSIKNGLVWLFIQDKYKDIYIPRWVKQGVALYLTKYYRVHTLKDLMKNNDYVPTIQELESNEETSSFGLINGFLVSYSLIQFLDSKYGWNDILEILSDYSNIEKVTKKSKAALRDVWLKSFEPS